MNKKTASEFEILLKRAHSKIKAATRLANEGIASEEAWIKFDKTCNDAESDLVDACVVGGVPKEIQKQLEASYWEIEDLRIRASWDWQMLWREQEALRDPTGRYGLMRARRLKMEAALQDGDDDGNGHHSPKP